VNRSKSQQAMRPRERGYVLLTVLLFASLLALAAVAVAPNLARQIRRDQETELIHRAIQYRRAVRQFTKKTGRYPMKLEDLESTNGVRFLRRRYKDPVTGQEFRVLHMADVPAAIGTSSNAWSLQPGKDANTNASGDDSNSAGQDPASGTAQNSQPSASNQPTPSGALSSSSPGNSLSGNSGSSSNNTTFGGGVIIGVASTSKKKTIREFETRNHYNQWLFFYDPGFDRAFEVQGPTPLTHPPANLNAPVAGGTPQSSGAPQNSGALQNSAGPASTTDCFGMREPRPSGRPHC